LIVPRPVKSCYDITRIVDNLDDDPRDCVISILWQQKFTLRKAAFAAVKACDRKQVSEMAWRETEAAVIRNAFARLMQGFGMKEARQLAINAIDAFGRTEVSRLSETLRSEPLLNVPTPGDSAQVVNLRDLETSTGSAPDADMQENTIGASRRAEVSTLNETSRSEPLLSVPSPGEGVRVANVSDRETSTGNAPDAGMKQKTVFVRVRSGIPDRLKRNPERLKDWLRQVIPIDFPQDTAFSLHRGGRTGGFWVTFPTADAAQRYLLYQTGYVTDHEKPAEHLTRWDDIQISPKSRSRFGQARWTESNPSSDQHQRTTQRPSGTGQASNVIFVRARQGLPETVRDGTETPDTWLKKLLKIDLPALVSCFLHRGSE
jgi:hypothetical protein